MHLKNHSSGWLTAPADFSRYAESKVHQTDHRMNNFLMWLMVMAVALSILAISLFIPNYISAYLSLTRTGALRRSLIIWKRIAGFLLGGGRKSVLAPVEIYRVDHLKNTPVWGQVLQYYIF